MSGCGTCGHVGTQHLPLGGGCLVCACTAWTPAVITYSTSTNSPAPTDPKGATR